ncbi:cytochrome C oxidase subunit II [Thiobacillus sp.]|uniref:cytochrome C oxidase subunit II n=1 Tax=Thiobacillus sp. TaxID=924 RepID=UPI0025F7D6F5|nr:cytochrome C oxidase subunit II [Thiobacillus sp.]
MYQQLAWQITVALTAVLGLVFAYIALKSGRRTEYAPLQKRAYRLRRGLFWALVLLLTPILVYSMSELPYDAAQRHKGDKPQVIDAVGYQWYWTLSASEVTVGRPVEFHVTSGDINHGFGIYDENMRLVGQTQAMPGYVNKLQLVFHKAGTYKALCMEYCGLAHHNMTAEIRAVESTPTGGRK